MQTQQTLDEQPAVNFTETPAGAALDALVATGVMGWTVTPEEDCWRIHNLQGVSWVESSPDLISLGRATSKEDPYFNYSLPYYSTEIEDAWLVVERLKKLGYAFCCWDTPEFSSFAGQIAVFRRGVHPPSRDHLRENDHMGSGHMEDSMPLAICRAALAAIEHEKGVG